MIGLRSGLTPIITKHEALPVTLRTETRIFLGKSIVHRKRMVWNPVLCISGFSLKLGFSQCFGHVIKVNTKIINNGR